MAIIQYLINQMFEEKEDAFRRNMIVADQLRRDGSDAITPILTDLFARKAAGKLLTDRVFDTIGCPVFHLVDVIEKLAGAEHAKQLAEMLLWDEIALDHISSTRRKLVAALTRVGDSSVVPLLRNYREKIRPRFLEEHARVIAMGERPRDYFLMPRGTPYFYATIDLQEVKGAIASCQQRN